MTNSKNRSGKSYLVGTAGHVDHGKTHLIRALTGIDTDRLKEERQRGISIELGFAHFSLPSGRKVGIVDVPGHEKFVRQMLAGASGMDIVMLVIAADEGMMPQTREHLDILTLLGVSHGIVVINKIDLVDDEWLELIKDDVREGLKETVFEEAPMYFVSSLTGQGIKELTQGIDKILEVVESKNTNGPVRLPIDRVFTIQGFGTVVTGTLHNGIVHLGDELAIEPGQLVGKVRSLQVHNQKVEKAEAGQRVAINLAGIDVEEVEKGSVVMTPQAFPVGKILDLKVTCLKSMDKPLKQRQRIRFHIGTSEVLGRIHLLEKEEIAPGHEGYAQILLEEPVVAAPQDRFVIRHYSPAYTIAGGKVLGFAEKKKKRFNEEAIAQMQLKDQGDPLVQLEQELLEPKNLKECAEIFHISQETAASWLEELHDQEKIEVWEEDGAKLYWQKKAAQNWRNSLINEIENYQNRYPLRGGISREELKTKLGIKWSKSRWQNILEQGAKRNYFALSGHKVCLTESTKLPEDISKRIECLRTKWQEAYLTPPNIDVAVKECNINKNEVSEYANHLVDNGEWIPVEGMYFNAEALNKARNLLVDLIKEKGEVAVSDLKDVWGTSRKYTVPLLEFFDRQKVTKRQGDKRVLF